MKVVLLAVLFAVCAFAQGAPDDSITLCGVRLKIGMDRGPVMREIAAECNAKAFSPDGKMWDLFKKGNGENVGTVAFFDGKVGSVSKSWVTTKDAWNLVDGLYFVSRQISRQQSVPCVLRTDFDEHQGMEFKRVTVQCGRKSIVMVAAQLNGNPAVSRFLCKHSRGLMFQANYTGCTRAEGKALRRRNLSAGSVAGIRRDRAQLVPASSESWR